MVSALGSMPLVLQLATTAAVALLFLYVFGTSFPCDPAAASHSQDATLALFWMHRTHHTPYRDWFREPGPEASAETRRAFQALVGEGNVVMPIHGVYLWVLGHAVRLYTTATISSPRTAVLMQFWEEDFFANADAATEGDRLAAVRSRGPALFMARWVSALVLAPLLFQLAVEVLWPLSAKVAALLATATVQRQAAVQALSGRPREQSPSGTNVAQAWSRKLCGVVFSALFVFVVVPTMALELTTLHPVCLCTCALLYCVKLLILDECMLTSPESYTHDRFTNKEEEKLFQQNSVFAFPMKTPLTLRYLCQAGALLVAVALTLRPCLPLVLGLAGWLVTLCFIRIHRRVLVRVKAPDGGADTPEAAADGFVDIGFSSYQDKMYAQACLCYVMSGALAVAFLVCFPFVFRRQNLFDFMHVFVPSYQADRGAYRTLHGTAGGTAHGSAGVASLSEADRFLSVTGALEISSQCTNDPLSLPHHFSCSRPVLNVFTLSEFFGLPWTSLTVRFASLVAASTVDSYTDGSMWMHYISITTMVLTNAVPALVVLAYRVRRPYMTFDTPELFVREYTKQREAFFNYWAVQADHLRARKNYPPPEKPFSTAPASAETKAGKGKHADDVTKTCISHEEYVLKQLTLLLWVLVGLATSMNLFLVRGGLPISLASAVLPPVGLLYAMQGAIGIAARLAPEPFEPTHNRRQYDSIEEMRVERQHAARVERERNERKKEAAPKEDEDEGKKQTERQTQKPLPPMTDAPLPLIPPEHERVRTFTSGSYSYTTPAFNADGTGWSLASRWCSPAALGEHTDAAWCMLLVTTVLAICVQAYPLTTEGVPMSSDVGGRSAFLTTPRLSSLHHLSGGALVLGTAAITLCVELARSKFWLRMDLLTFTVLMLLQAAGGYAAVKGLFWTSPEGSPAGGADAVGLWLRGLAEALCGPRELYDLFTSLSQSSNHTADLPFELWRHMYQHVVAALVILIAAVHASFRMARCMLESEEVRFVDTAKEMEMIYNAAKDEGVREQSAQRAAPQKAQKNKRK